MTNKEKLKNLLKNVSDTYGDFVYGMLLAVNGHDDYVIKLIDFIEKNPSANSSEISTSLTDKLERRPKLNPETNQFEVPEIPEI